MNTNTGKNKYGIKLEDYSDFASYQRALKVAHNKDYKKSYVGKLLNARYKKSDMGKIANARYKSSVKGRKLGNALSNKRRASKLQRTPAWADLEAIKQFYLNCPKGYQVDHIVPLQGVNVSGFHVLNNLQYLTAFENNSKGNKYAL